MSVQAEAAAATVAGRAATKGAANFIVPAALARLELAMAWSGRNRGLSSDSTRMEALHGHRAVEVRN